MCGAFSQIASNIRSKFIGIKEACKFLIEILTIFKLFIFTTAHFNNHNLLL